MSVSVSVSAGKVYLAHLHLCPSQPFFFLPPLPVFPLRSFLEIFSLINDSLFAIPGSVSESASVRADVRYLLVAELESYHIKCTFYSNSSWHFDLTPLITASQHARPPVSSLKEVDGLVVDEEVVDTAAKTR